MDMSASPDELEDLRAFPAVWLRDNCPCPSCRDPLSGQKLRDVLDVAIDISIGAVQQAPGSADSVVVTFLPDGHRAEFSRTWLATQASGPAGDGRSEADKELWRAADLAGRIPEGEWSHYNSDNEERLRVLRAVRRLGFVLLHGTPLAEGTVLRVAETFGYVRETNYGRLFDVRVEGRPTNLAFTSREISPHTDNPYRDPVPTMQLLHCLANGVVGGDSGLVDGFQAASKLRAEAQGAFELLASTPVLFAWSDDRTSLCAERPMLGLDGRGAVREVRFNNRSMQAMRLSHDELVAFYEAYRHFAEIVGRPELRLHLRLDPGDCLVFDNVRVLHARTAFSAGAGEQQGRHLQGCYADLDGLSSTIAVLERLVGKPDAVVAA